MNLSISWQRLLGTAILSASALSLEITLTRLFSLLYFPPYVYFIISVSILGIGMGAALPALRPALAVEKRLTQYCFGASAATLLLLVLAVVGPASVIQMPLFALLALTFACFGLVISSIFTLHSAAGRVLYMADLLGRGCRSAAVDSAAGPIWRAQCGHGRGFRLLSRRRIFRAWPTSAAVDGGSGDMRGGIRRQYGYGFALQVEMTTVIPARSPSLPRWKLAEKSSRAGGMPLPERTCLIPAGANRCAFMWTAGRRPSCQIKRRLRN